MRPAPDTAIWTVRRDLLNSSDAEEFVAEIDNAKGELPARIDKWLERFQLRGRGGEDWGAARPNRLSPFCARMPIIAVSPWSFVMRINPRTAATRHNLGFC